MRNSFELFFGGSILIGLILFSEVPAGHKAAEKGKPGIILVASQKSDTVFVAPPTGERETDRTSILAALEEIEPGGTIQFAPGTYLMGGEIIRITVPNITLMGHPDGTTLRGCNPGEFSMEDIKGFGNNCNGLELYAGGQSVLDLTFENLFWGLHIGCCWETIPKMMPGDGGHIIEGNTFTGNSNALRVNGFWSAPTLIRNNRFLNNWHAIAVYGNTVHILDNEITAPAPGEVQGFGFPAEGIHLARPLELYESGKNVVRSCENNVISGNLIEGVTEGIMMTADVPGITCRNNVISNNTIIIKRARPVVFPDFLAVNAEGDSTVVGVPLALRGHFENNRIEDNIIRGAEGLAIEIRGGSNNQIVNNTISGVSLRKPFPGNAIPAIPILGGDPENWRSANGSGIWLSPGSNGNEITNNRFENIAFAAVYVEGDSNRVELNTGKETVRDLGSDNKIGEIVKAAKTTVVFTNITIIDVRQGEAKPAMTVMISGEEITEVGPVGTIEIPVAAKVIDATGKYLIPGLWDMHAHTTTDRNTRKIIFPLYISHGITGIRSMNADCFEEGQPNCREEGSSAILATIEEVNQWHREMAAGTLVGPQVVAGSFPVNSPPPGEESTPQYPRTGEHGQAHARMLKERGVDFIKIYDELSREAYFGLTEEANRLGIPFAGHVPIAVRASEASEAGQRSIEHLGRGNILEECSSREEELRRRLIEIFKNGKMGERLSPDGPELLLLNLEMLATYDAEKCLALAERFVRNETWIVPTLMVNRLPGELGEGWREDPYTRFLLPEERQYFEWEEEVNSRDLGNAEQREVISQWIRDMTNTLHKAGVPMLAGSDSGSAGVFWGKSLHEELELLVDAGLSEAEALRAATLGPAEFFHTTDILGTIEEGKKADLVLLDANPLQDISNTQKINGVVLNGRYLDRQTLDEMLLNAEKAAAGD